MKEKLLYSILLSLYAISIKAQPTAFNCGNGRYVNDVFAAVTRDTGIIFGANTVPVYALSPGVPPLPVNPVPVTLKLNFYQPQGDVATKRPLIILAFGGSFYFGNRYDLDSLCTRLARKGYATASIDYRLIYPDEYNIGTVYAVPSLLADAVVKACADMKAAIRFFKHNAATTNSYKIDTTKIFVGGYSAGAITALQTAYTDDVLENPTTTAAYAANGGIEGNTDLPGTPLLPAHSANGIAGVLSIAGGVEDTSLIDAANPPLYMAHGTLDSTVFYNYGAANGTTFSLYGGGLMKVRASNIGLSNQLYTILNGNHQSPASLDSVYLNQIIAGAATFFQPIVCTAILPVSLTSFLVETSNCTALLKWQTASESNSIRYEIEVSADGSRYIKTGEVKSKNAANGSAYSYSYKSFNGTSFYRLKMIDADGNYTYSPVQKLSLSCNRNLIQVYPNPAKEQTLITGLRAGMQVHLLNAQGQKLLLQKVRNPVLQVSLSSFASGLYLVQVTDEAGSVISNTRLIKE